MAVDFNIKDTADAKKTPKRVAFVKNRTAARVKREDEEMVMTVPHLVVREIIAFEVMVIVLAVVSLLFNAPLEWIANPDHTPNPAKAPWYFLGLQELLHYFPPVVGGVILPLLVVIALIIIPYFHVNLKSEGMWKENARQTFVIVASIVASITVLLLLYQVYAMVLPTLIVTTLMIVPYFSRSENRFITYIATRPLSWWIMTWFVTIVTVLTVIGTLFRGPGWSWTWPWQKIY
jgi:quinol-cytochrome oxidoreductase complex cytochrome b subunit